MARTSSGGKQNRKGSSGGADKKPSGSTAQGGGAKGGAAEGRQEQSEREQLLKELRALIKEVDEEGLRFLIRQANTIIYNMKVDELNRVREQEDEERRSARAARAGAQSGDSEGPTVFFEAGKRSSGYIMEIDGVRSIMDEAELMQLVRLAQNAASPEVATRKLYKWINDNRDDILMEVDLRPGGQRLAALYERLKSDFAIRR
jgi:hypothetical protein